MRAFAFHSYVTNVYSQGLDPQTFGERCSSLVLKTIEALKPVKDLMHTITADNGKEFAKHQEIAKELEISFYFCKSYLVISHQMRILIQY